MSGMSTTLAELKEMTAVPAGLKHRREAIARAAQAAIGMVEAFAKANDWSELTQEPFFNRIEIFETKEALWTRILELNEVSDIPPPTDAVTGALEKETLMAIPFEEARRARPEYFRTERDWVQALAHEIVHRLHVRILSGDEEAMGPQWFYEGFAVIGSGQPLGCDIEVRDVGHALDLAAATDRGAYACYAAALRFFMRRIPLKRLVQRAADPDFEAWLRAAAEGAEPSPDD